MDSEETVVLGIDMSSNVFHCNVPGAIKVIR